MSSNSLWLADDSGARRRLPAMHGGACLSLHGRDMQYLKAAARGIVLLALIACSAFRTACAFVYPEHRDIALLAVGKLDPDRRAVFDRL